MISEIEFATRYTSFWQGVAPTSELYVRRINAGLYVRFEPPLKGRSHPTRRALVNEAAFRLFVGFLSGTGDINAAIQDAALRVGGLRTEIQPPGLDPNDYLEIDNLADRLRRFVLMLSPKTTLVGPVFPGCGFVQHCEGDILADETLIEVKSGERAFRSTDFRQLLIYLALNWSANRYRIKKICLVNPRIGIYFETSVESFCFEFAGQSSVALFSAIAFALSGEAISR